MKNIFDQRLPALKFLIFASILGRRPDRFREALIEYSSDAISPVSFLETEVG